VNIKCTESFALELAEKAKDATLNIIRLFSATQSANAIPLLSSSDSRRHRFDFHLHSDNKNKFTQTTKYNFPTEHSGAKEFWSGFLIGKRMEKNLVSLSMKIPEMILSKSTPKARIVELLERALMWYGDAVLERDTQQKIQKLVISIEAIVNFKDGDVTGNFCKRVSNLNVTHSGIDSAIGEQALEPFIIFHYLDLIKSITI